MVTPGPLDFSKSGDSAVSGLSSKGGCRAPTRTSCSDSFRVTHRDLSGLLSSWLQFSGLNLGVRASYFPATVKTEQVRERTPERVTPSSSVCRDQEFCQQSLYPPVDLVYEGSIPHSIWSATTEGFSWSPGSDPAERTPIRPPAEWSSNTRAAIMRRHCECRGTGHWLGAQAASVGWCATTTSAASAGVTPG